MQNKTNFVLNILLTKMLLISKSLNQTLTGSSFCYIFEIAEKPYTGIRPIIIKKAPLYKKAPPLLGTKIFKGGGFLNNLDDGKSGETKKK